VIIMYLILRPKDGDHPNSWCVRRDERLIDTLRYLKEEGYEIGKDIFVVPVHDDVWRMSRSVNWYSLLGDEETRDGTGEEVSLRPQIRNSADGTDAAHMDNMASDMYTSVEQELNFDVPAGDSRFSYLNRVAGSSTEKAEQVTEEAPRTPANGGEDEAPRTRLSAKPGQKPIEVYIGPIFPAGESREKIDKN